MNPDTDPKPEPGSPLKQIRTFQGDIAEALKRQQESLVSIQRAEQFKRGSRVSPVSDTSDIYRTRKETFLLVIGSILLFALGSVGVWYGYTEFINKTSTPVGNTPENRFIAINDEVTLDLKNPTRSSLISSIADSSKDLSRNGVRQILLNRVGTTSIPFSTADLMTTLESRAPGSLVRAFSPLFMLGTIEESTSETGVSNFMIIKLTSFENAFAGMLVWEKNMAQDLGPLFRTAQFIKDIPLEKTFADLTDRNKDVRALYFGEIPVLMYSFFDNNMLIITDDLETLRTVLDRLTREKLSR